MAIDFRLISIITIAQRGSSNIGYRVDIASLAVGIDEEVLGDTLSHTQSVVLCRQVEGWSIEYLLCSHIKPVVCTRCFA